MSRSSWKLLNTFNENIELNHKNIKIIKRNKIITKDFLNKKVSIYNGKTFINVFIDKLKLGYKFGEFSFTKKIPIHKIKKKLKK